MHPTIFCGSSEVGMGEWLGINLDDPILLSYDFISLLFTSIQIADVINLFIFSKEGLSLLSHCCYIYV
jgi:hypothetical protein